MTTTEEQLDSASDEVGPQPYDRSCVKPIFRAPLERCPAVAVESAKPCSGVLCEVARTARVKRSALGSSPT